VHHVLAGLKEVDQAIVFPLLEYMKNDGLAVGPESSACERIIIMDYLAAVLDGLPHLLGAETGIDEGTSYPDLDEIQETEIHTRIANIHL
jgi:hypothetical protein